MVLLTEDAVTPAPADTASGNAGGLSPAEVTMLPALCMVTHTASAQAIIVDAKTPEESGEDAVAVPLWP